MDMGSWPQVWNDGGVWAALQFEQCNHLSVLGGDSSNVHVDGQGYVWWWRVILSGDDVRPHMFVFHQCKDLLVQNLYVINSPQFHFYPWDVANVLFKNVSVVVDAVQRDLPVFPLNTDGIDPSGTNITIEDCYIQNYDDAVAVKVSSSHFP
jgi:polygalacturonase